MGVVYEATQISLNRTVALKVLAPHLSDDISFRERFRREGQIQAGIDHDAHRDRLRGGRERAWLLHRDAADPRAEPEGHDRGSPARPRADAAHTAARSPTRSTSAHEAGLIHRDIKPQNILVGGRDQAFLADFGLTKATGEQSLTRTGQFVGTLRLHLARADPGRARDHAERRVLARRRALRVLHRRGPVSRRTPRRRSCTRTWPTRRRRSPTIGPSCRRTLDEVIATGMAKEPAERYESARELLHDDERVLHPPHARRLHAPGTDRGAAGDRASGRPRPRSRRGRPGPPDDAPPTEPGALEAETAPRSGHPETVRSAEPPEPDRRRGSRGVGARRHTRQRRRPARGARCHDPRRGPLRDGARAVAGRGGAPAG